MSYVDKRQPFGCLFRFWCLNPAHYRGARRALIEVGSRISRGAGHGGLRHVHQFARAHVMKAQPAKLAFCKYVFVEPARGFTEHREGIFFRRAVGVHFDETPLGPAQNMHVLFKPGAKAVHRWRIISLQISVLDAHTEGAGPARQGEGALNKKEFVAPFGAHAHGLRVFVGTAPREIARGLREDIHEAWLAFVGRARKGKIGVATEAPEKRQLRIYAAMTAVGAGVGEAPISVNEAPSGLAIDDGEKSVSTEVFQGFIEFRPQRFARVVFVVKVNFELAVTMLRELAEPLEKGAIVLIAGEKKCVTRTAPAGVFEAPRELRVRGAPTLDPFQSARPRLAAPKGFVVIAKAKKDVSDGFAVACAARKAIFCPGPEPPMKLLFF